MINYETLMLTRTEMTDDEFSALERQMDKIVSGKKGRITVFDKWGKYKLAYPVKKNVYGVYVLARYEVPEEELSSLFSEIDSLFRIKYNELVMRHVTVRLEDGVSMAYKYPEPIGSHGTSNLESFIKENKMKGLIDTPVEGKASAEKKAEESKEVAVDKAVEGEDAAVESKVDSTEEASEEVSTSTEEASAVEESENSDSSKTEEN